MVVELSRDPIAGITTFTSVNRRRSSMLCLSRVLPSFISFHVNSQYMFFSVFNVEYFIRSRAVSRATKNLEFQNSYRKYSTSTYK